MRNILIGFILGGVLVGGANYVVAQTPLQQHQQQQLDSWRLQQMQQQQEWNQMQQDCQNVQPGGLYGTPRMNQGGTFVNPKNPC
jgi:hypothetical protein